MILFLSFFSPLRVLKKKLRAFFFCYMSVHIAFSFFFYFSSTLLLVSLPPTNQAFFFLLLYRNQISVSFSETKTQSEFSFLSFLRPAAAPVLPAAAAIGAAAAAATKNYIYFSVLLLLSGNTFFFPISFLFFCRSTFSCRFFLEGDAASANPGLEEGGK